MTVQISNNSNSVSATNPDAEQSTETEVIEKTATVNDDIAKVLHKMFMSSTEPPKPANKHSIIGVCGTPEPKEKTLPVAIPKRDDQPNIIGVCGTPEPKPKTLPVAIPKRDDQPNIIGICGTPEPKSRPAPAINLEKKALNDLGENFDLIARGDGLISIAELKAAARGDFPRVRFGQIQATPEAMDRAQKAAQYFLAHPDKLKAVDVALGVNTGHKKNSTVDGLIARDDIATRMNKMPLSQAEVAVVRVLQKSKGEDGAPLTFTIKTLEALAANPKATAAEREAARYVLDNPAFMVRLDTANQVARGRGTDGFGDGKITDSDLKTLLNRPEAKKSVRQDTPAQIAEQKTALSNLGQSFDLISGGKNLISKADLQAAARGIFPSAAFGEIDASAEAKRKAQSAAQYFLTHSNKLNAVDTGLGKNIGDSRINKVDGLISRDDIATRMNKMPLSTTEIGVVRTLQESKGAGGKPFSFNEQSLTVMANDPKATLKQRQAAQYVLDNPAFRVRLDTASQVATRHGTGGFGDGKIVESDFNALLNRPEARALA